MTKYTFDDITVGKEGLLKGPFGSDLKRSLYVPKGKDTYKVYVQENILSENNDAGTHYISKEYYEKKMSRYAVKEGDFIVTCDGTLGEIFQLKNIKENGIISSSLLRITLNSNLVDDNYFYYLWKAIIRKQLITQGNNSVLKHLPGIEVIRKHEIELPDLKTQRKVGQILKLIDNKIKNNNAISSELESLAKTIYDYWFLQFDFPDENGNPYRSSGGKMVWNDELKREIPEGWKAVQIADILGQYPRTQTVNRDDYKKEEKYTIIDQSKDFICGYSDDSNKVLHMKDCIVYGDHTTFLKYINFDFCRGADGTQVINSKEANLSNILLYYELKELPIIEIGYKRHFKFLKSQYIIVPSKQINDLFRNASKTLFDKKKNILKENRQLTSLRDFLLPMLMNGQVTFKEAD